MKKIDLKGLDISCYTEKLSNGLEIFMIPYKNKKNYFISYATRFGSDVLEFTDNLGKKKKPPLGIAHFLEHKMFEQEDGTDPFTYFSASGTDSNASTSFDNTQYICYGTKKFEDNLRYLLKFVNSPYYTDENVEKEKGIIGQEIMMYDDYPDWRVYLNTMQAMYHNNPIKIDITGTIETISKIDKDILYKCYNTFYNPANMALVVAGDFKPEEILEEIKKRLIDKKSSASIKRIYPEEPESIVKEKIEQKLEVSQPLYTIGIKEVKQLNALESKNETVRKCIAMEILLTLLFGKSSNLYQELYKEGILFGAPSLDYEFGKNYAHVLITGQSPEPEKLYERFKQEVEKFKQNGINEEDFNRIKKTIYGRYVKDYDDVQDIAKMFLSDYFKGINSFDYLEEIEGINVEYLNQVLNFVFKEDKMVISIVKN